MHISTDCVFSGFSGNYNESDQPDAIDCYGQTKALGEEISETALVLRTSIIGIEKKSAHGLLSWYSSQNTPVDGYVNAIYSGLSMREFANSIHSLWSKHTYTGLYNVSSDPISKFDLLNLLYMLALVHGQCR